LLGSGGPSFGGGPRHPLAEGVDHAGVGDRSPEDAKDPPGLHRAGLGNREAAGYEM
jgi:hypothetical protein